MNNNLFPTLLLMSMMLFSFNDAQSITCDDTRECEDGHLGNEIVNCYGYYGCKYATITSSEVWSYAYATYKASINSQSVYGFGYKAGEFAIIKATYVYSYGYVSSLYADISPMSSYLEVYFYGHYSGAHAAINCNDGDMCKIDCGRSHGCYKTTIYCYSGADCDYDCSQDPEYCPDQIGEGGDESSDLYLSDVQIKAIYDRNVAEKNKRAEAEKEGNTFGVESELPMMDVFEHPPTFGGGVAHDAHSSDKRTISFGLGTVILVVLISNVIVFVIGYRCKARQVNYAEFTKLLSLE